jgi:Peptidase family M48
VTLFSTDRASFRAIVLHELAHLGDADVNKTYFSLASWWAFVIVALIPFTVISLIGFVQAPYVLLNEAWRVLAMTVLVFLILASTLRVREFYADIRSAIYENSAGPLLRVLNMLEKPKSRWHRLTLFHPDPLERAQTLNETDRLFHLSFWDALGFGIAIGIAAPNVQDLLFSFFNLLPQIAASDIPDPLDCNGNLDLVRRLNLQPIAPLVLHLWLSDC